MQEQLATHHMKVFVCECVCACVRVCVLSRGRPPRAMPVTERRNVCVCVCVFFHGDGRLAPCQSPTEGTFMCECVGVFVYRKTYDACLYLYVFAFMNAGAVTFFICCQS